MLPYIQRRPVPRSCTTRPCRQRRISQVPYRYITPQFSDDATYMFQMHKIEAQIFFTNKISLDTAGTVSSSIQASPITGGPTEARASYPCTCRIDICDLIQAAGITVTAMTATQAARGASAVFSPSFALNNPLGQIADLISPGGQRLRSWSTQFALPFRSARLVG